MLLTGALYAAILVATVLAFAAVRSRSARQAILLVASYGAYMTWGRWFVAALLASTVMNFVVGRWLRRDPRGMTLATGLVLNVLVLATFKYVPALAVFSGLPSLAPYAHMARPIGISFWTFQAMSYLFDLYRGEELDPSFAEFAVYMAFFPVAISGPVCRAPEMLPRFRSEGPLAWSNVMKGLRRITTGVLMMQLAHLLGNGILGGDGINRGFDRLSAWTGADVWCLALGYGLQLFFNFAGYSHIAIGAARALGIEVPENFARPFASTTPSVFWTRWHMSLSFWIRDYVFLPLAKLRRNSWWRNLALLISMVLFGVWHKATVLFVLWGFYHGIILVLHRQAQQVQRRLQEGPPAALWEPLWWAVTMAGINLGWIFFRADSLLQARRMLAAVVSGSYAAHHLDGSLFALVAALAVGYAAVSLANAACDRAVLQQGGDAAGSGVLSQIARWRWLWVPPLYAVTLILVSVVTAAHSAGAVAQLMYSAF